MRTILYASVACSQQRYKTLFDKCKIKSGQAVQKYNRLIMEGMAKTQRVSVEAVVSTPISRNTHSKLLFNSIEDNEEGVTYHYLPEINIKRMKDVVNVITSFFYVLNIGHKQKALKVVADVLNAPVAMGAYLASKVIRCPYVITVTDDPELCGCGFLYKKTSYYLINKCSGYIFITKEMNERYNVDGKPYIIMEGLVDINEVDSLKDEQTNQRSYSNKFIIMYTGSLHKIYGIGNLMDGFIKAEIPNSELHIYGDGDYRSEVENKSKEFNNIKYFGTVLSSEIVERQKTASLLVNPRPIDEEYVKYSFPSKNMEYMVSGTPVLTTDLPGMPSEYKEFVYILEDYSSDGIKNKLLEISKIECSMRENMGMSARDFVLRKKNNVVQAEKIISMIEGLK